MNKHFAQHLSRFLLLIVLALSSGCGPATIVPPATLTPALSQTPTSTATPEPIHPEGTIIYSDHKTIYSVNLQDQEIKRIYTSDYILSDLIVIKNTVYFDKDEAPDNKRVFRLNLDGTSLEQLTPTPIGYLTGVAPNGKYLTYISKDRGLYILNIDNKTPARIEALGSGYDYIRFSSWSPDSKMLLYFKVFHSDSEGRLFLYIVDEKKSIELFLGKMFNLSPLLWAPNGMNLLLTIYNEGRQETCIFNTPNGALSCIPIDGYTQGAVWSSDSRFLLLSIINNSQYGLYNLNIENKSVDQVVKNNNIYLDQNLFNWSSNMILYEEEGVNTHFLYSLDLNSKELTKLQSQRGIEVVGNGGAVYAWHFSPTWSPDGRFFAYLTMSDPGTTNYQQIVTLNIQSIDTGGRSELQVPSKDLLIDGLFWLYPSK